MQYLKNSSQAIARAVHVLQLISTADHGTEKLCLSAIALCLGSRLSTHWCQWLRKLKPSGIFNTHLSQLLLVSAGFPVK